MLRHRSLKLFTLALAFLVASATATMAQSHGFNFDIGIGQVLPDGETDGSMGVAEFRIDFRPSDIFVFSGQISRAQRDDLSLDGDKSVYDYGLTASFELHVFTAVKFDPYFSAGYGGHDVPVEGSLPDHDYASWHVGAGLDLHMGDEIGLAFDAKLARPFDQEDGEEYVQITAGLILGS